MEIVFIDEDLAILYEGGKVKRKELKSNPQLQKQFGKVIDRLKSLEKIEDAFIFNALNYEKLSGNLKGKSSVRVNNQYRIIFEERVNEEDVVVILCIEELSNHYQ